MKKPPIRRTVRTIRPSDKQINMYLGEELIGVVKPVEVTFSTVYLAPKE